MVGRAVRRIRSLLSMGRVEGEMEEEMRIHLEMEIEERVRSGMDPAEARRTALRDFGSMDRFKEEAREVRGLHSWEVARQDVRFALRVLRQNRGFAALAILTLALGIGANTAVFSVVNRLVLQPLPYPGADRIVTLWELGEGGSPISVTGGNFFDWRELSRSFDEIALLNDPRYAGPTTVLGTEQAVRAEAAAVTDGFFRVFGVQPQLGRAFNADEARPGGEAVAVVSHGFWRTHLGGDPAVLGRTLDLYGESYRVIGVMPPHFGFPGTSDLWVPLERWTVSPSRTAHNYMAVARLREGVPLSAAQREVDGITSMLRERHGSEMDALGARVTRLQDELVGDMRRPLFLLLGAAGLVLLIACTNLASAFLARGAARTREVAIRASLGASRPRLIRQLLTESLVLAAIGAGVGLLLASVILRTLVALGPTSLQVAGRVALDGWAMAFAAALAMLTAVLFGLMPALRVSATELSETLRSGGRGGTEAGERSGWRWLVGVEVALAVLLLTGSALLIQSFRRVLDVDTGFNPSSVLTIDVDMPDSRYNTDPLRAGFYGSLLDELGRLPGVERAGMIQHLPLAGRSFAGFFEIEGRGQSDVPAAYRVASGGYFEAMGIPLLRGRLFDERDHAETGDVALVNRWLADHLWPGEEVLGKRIRNLANDAWVYPDRWITVIGVVDDVRHDGLAARAGPEIYVHYLQRPERASSGVITLRTSVPPGTLIGVARSRIRTIDPDVPAEFATMSSRMVESVADRRFTMVMLGSFALVALILSAVGIYGVVSNWVARRTREIGIRMALGAEPRAVRALVQGSAMRIVLAGLVAGLVAAILLSRALGGMLYEVSPTDPATLAAVVAVLGSVAWLAGYIPARRGTRVDPMVTMRSE